MSDIPSGLYKPRNNLGKRDGVPKFGQTTPLKENNGIVIGGVGRGTAPAPVWDIRPMAPGDPKWRSKSGTVTAPISVDSSPEILGPFSIPPSNAGRLPAARFGSQSSSSAIQQRPMDDLSRWAAPIRKPTGMVSSWKREPEAPGFGRNGEYTGSDYLDTKTTIESMKTFIDSISNSPPSRRTRARKKEAEDAVEQAKGASDHQEEDEPDGVVDGLKVTLLPHQIKGLDFLLHSEDGKHKGGLLADDMGLGKTIQSISLILSHPMSSTKAELEIEKEKLQKQLTFPLEMHRGTLIVAPLALIRQWENEIKEKTDGRLKTLVHHGSNRTRSWKDLTHYDVVITTPQVLVSEHKDTNNDVRIACFGLHWWRIIVDEAHTIKNPSAKSTIACCQIQAKHRWCLTGTPLQNNLDELQSLLHFLKVDPWESKAVWKEQITKPLNNNRGGLAIKRIQTILKAVMLRRTKAILQAAANESSKNSNQKIQGEKPLKLDLGARTVKAISCSFDEDERKYYTRIQTRMNDRVEDLLSGNKKNTMASVLVIMMRLRQLCNHPDLVAGKLNADKEVDFTSSKKLTAKSKSDTSLIPDDNSVEMDDITALLGGMTVASKTCELCEKALSKEDKQCDEGHCAECRDLMSLAPKKRKPETLKHGKTKNNQSNPDIELASLLGNLNMVEPEKENKRKMRRGIIIDSEDDEDVPAESDLCLSRSGHDDKRKTTKVKRADAQVGRRRQPIILDSDDEDDESNKSIEAEEGDDTLSNVTASTHSVQEQSGFLDLEAEETSREEESDADTDDEGKDIETSEADSTSVVEGFEEGEEDEDFGPSTPFASAKIRNLMSILNREAGQGNKTIVFSAFTTMLDKIEPFLRSRHIMYARYDGSMRNDARETSLARLKTDPECQVLLCSLKCGALGLNLTAANRVVILEPFWNPFVEEQAIDRVHRIGQATDVVVYKMTIKNTIESRILDLQDRKRKMAEAAFGATGSLQQKGDRGKLTKSDLIFLFGREAEIAHRKDDDDDLAHHFKAKPNLMDHDFESKDSYEQLTSSAKVASSSRSAGANSRGVSKKQSVERRQEHSVYGRR